MVGLFVDFYLGFKIFKKVDLKKNFFFLIDFDERYLIEYLNCFVYYSIKYVFFLNYFFI